jgi:hypothetical protein
MRIPIQVRISFHLSPFRQHIEGFWRQSEMNLPQSYRTLFQFSGAVLTWTLDEAPIATGIPERQGGVAKRKTVSYSEIDSSEISVVEVSGDESEDYSSDDLDEGTSEDDDWSDPDETYIPKKRLRMK